MQKILISLAILLPIFTSNASGFEASVAVTCANGLYRSPAGSLAALTPPLTPSASPGPRYTLLDGEQGNLSDPAAPLICTGGTLRGRDGAAWTRLDFRATPSVFAAKDGTKLNGLLLEPMQQKFKPPLVIFAHGSEKTSPIRQYYQLMFTGQNVSTFFYDKRGTGESKGIYTQDFTRLADDAASAVREARRLAVGRYSRIGLYGGSQGGWVAPAAALEAHVDFVEIAFGMVATPIEQDQWQVDVQLKERGFPDSILPKVHEVTKATADVARSDFSAHFDELELVRKTYGHEAWFDKIEGQYSGELLQGKISQAKDESPQVPWDYRSENVLKKLRIPQLWILAKDDSMAPSAPTIARLHALQKAGANIKIMVFPKTDHGIRLYTVDAEGQHHSYRMADGYLRLLSDWAKQTWQPPYGESSSDDATN